MEKERKYNKVQIVLDPDQTEQLKELHEITGLKPTDLIREAINALDFMVQEASQGAEVISKRPDGTYAELLSGPILRVLRRVREKMQETQNS